MQSNQLGNCSICGKLFLKEHTDHCLDCYHEIEREFKLLSDFLKVGKNRFASIQEASEFTGVDSKRIAEFIRDGRVYVEDYPNLGYPCAHCGTFIQRQMLCRSCFDQFTTEVDKTLKAEKLLEEMQKQPDSRRGSSKYWKLRE